VRGPRATPATAAAAGLLLPLLLRGAGDAATLVLAGATAFALLLLGVIGTELPAAALAGRHLTVLGWPRDAEGRAILRRAAARLGALTAGLVATTLALGFAARPA
jgi:hypothetical protein